MNRTTKVGEDEARRIWVVEPRQEAIPWAKPYGSTSPRGSSRARGRKPVRKSATLVSFETYPPFEFLGLRCTPKGERRPRDFSLAELRTSQGQGARERCVPLNPIGLIFSAPVKNTQVRDHVTFSPPLDGGRNDYDPWENQYDFTRLDYPHRKGRHYHVWLPESLQAARKYTLGFDVARLQDEFGRHLAEPVDFSFVTSHREPRLVLNHHSCRAGKRGGQRCPALCHQPEQGDGGL